MRAYLDFDSGKSGEEFSDRTHNRAIGTRWLTRHFRLRYAGARPKMNLTPRRPTLLVMPGGEESNCRDDPNKFAFDALRVDDRSVAAQRSCSSGVFSYAGDLEV
jgi:hypothetical protein